MAENLNSGHTDGRCCSENIFEHLSHITPLHKCMCLRLCGHFAHQGSLHNEMSSLSYCPCFFYQIQNNKVLLQDTREYLCCSLLQVTCSCRLSKAKPLKDCFGVCSEEHGGVLLSISMLFKKAKEVLSRSCAQTQQTAPLIQAARQQHRLQCSSKGCYI